MLQKLVFVVATIVLVTLGAMLTTPRTLVPCSWTFAGDTNTYGLLARLRRRGVHEWILSESS